MSLPHYSSETYFWEWCTSNFFCHQPSGVHQNIRFMSSIQCRDLLFVVKKQRHFQTCFLWDCRPSRSSSLDGGVCTCSWFAKKNMTQWMLCFWERLCEEIHQIFKGIQRQSNGGKIAQTIVDREMPMRGTPNQCGFSIVVWMGPRARLWMGKAEGMSKSNTQTQGNRVWPTSESLPKKDYSTPRDNCNISGTD